MKNFLLPLLVIFCGTVYAKNLTIDQAISIAKKHRPNIQALEYKVREAQLKVKEAWTGYFPRLALNSTYARATSFDVDRNGVFSSGLSVDVSASQLIYKFGGPQHDVKIAQAGIGIALHDKETQELMVAYEVAKSFIDCWVIQQQKAIIEQLNLSSKQTFNHAKIEKTAQLLDKQDFFGAIETRTVAHEEVANFKESAGIAQSQLMYLLGNTYNVNLVDDSTDNITVLDYQPVLLNNKDKKTVATYTQKALKNRPELKRLDKQIEMERENAKKERLSIGPSFELNGNGSRSAFTKNGQGAMAIVMNWPLFDGSASRYREAEADARATAAILQKEQTAQQILNDVNQAYFLYNKSLNGQQRNHIAIKRAESLFKRRQQECTIGMTTKTKLEEARYNLLQAKNNWVLAQANVAQQEVLLKYQCGEI